jgi:uncharacterized membrane protein
VLFGSFLAWSVLDFRAARRRRAAGTAAGRDDAALTVTARGTRNAITLVVGVLAWALFAFDLHARLIGVRPVDL